MWKILNSNFCIFLLGFIFVTVFGTWLTDRYQRNAWGFQNESESIQRAYEWEREKTYQLLQHRLTEGIKSLDRMSEVMNSRLFRLQQAFIQLQDSQSVDDSTWAEYRMTVDIWNAKLNFFETELARLVGDDFQSELNAYETDSYSAASCPEEPPSIHAKFWCANSALNKLKACKGCSDRSAIAKGLASYIRELDYQIDNFVISAGDEFLNQTAALDEFAIDRKY